MSLSLQFPDSIVYPNPLETHQSWSAHLQKKHMYIIDMYTTHIIGYTTISSVLKMLQTNGES